MKVIKLHLKQVALFLSLLMLLQGCTIYKSANVTLDEAVLSKTKVRIKTNDNQTLKFRNVEVENGNYHGLVYLKNTWVKTQINKNNIDKIQVKDNTLSIVLTIAIPFVIAGGALAIAVLNDPYLN